MDAADLMAALQSPVGYDDPYPFYAGLRARGPVVTVEPGYVVATSYDAVGAVLRDSRLGVDSEPSLLGRSILNTDAPEHTRMRRLMSGAFTPKRVNGLQHAVEAQAGALAEAMREQGGPADLMADFAYRLPVGVICELLGVPERDRDWFRPVASDFVILLEGTPLDPAQEAAALSAAELLQAYFAELVRARRRTPENDLISELVGAPDLAEDELLSNLALLLIAGFETTTNLIGNGVMTLLEHPRQADRLRRDPALAALFVEEFLRYDAPVQLTSRVARESTVLDGLPIEPGTFVMALLGSANRDSRRFGHADRFDPDRAGNTSISFGSGAHFCLGAMLARLEARIAFPLLLRTLPGLELAAEPVRRDRLVLRGYQSLPVSWG